MCFYLTDFYLHTPSDVHNLIRDNYDKMINDLREIVDDKKYFEKFKNAILSLSDLNNKVFIRYGIGCFILIIHTIIDAYHYSKNFEDFCCVVDDIYQLDCDIDREYISRVLRIIFPNKYMKDLVSIQNYKDMSNLRGMVIEILKNPNKYCYIVFYLR